MSNWNRVKIHREGRSLGKLVLAITLATSIMFNGNNVYANITKTMAVTIGEGGLDQSNLSKAVTIPNLKNVVKVTSNTGVVKHTVSGNNVTLSASGGTPSRVVSNPTKYSKTVSNSLTSSTDSFANTNPYSDAEGYTASGLPKNGVSRVISGAQTPAHSKEVTNQSSAKYNQDGYTGTLTQYLYSGELVEDKTKRAERYGPVLGYSEKDVPKYGSYYYSDSDGYSGTLYYYMTWGDANQGYGILYRGEVTKPGYDTRVYKYRGTVSRPASDTRVWQQDYKGTAYKPGTDNYYKYTVTIEYIDNTIPTLNINNLGTQYRKNNTEITITGTIQDVDNDTVTISATIGGKTKTTTITGTSASKPWELKWNTSELSEGNVSNIEITANDNKGGVTKETTVGKIVVDKTNPKIKVQIK